MSTGGEGLDWAEGLISRDPVKIVIEFVVDFICIDVKKEKLLYSL